MLLHHQNFGDSCAGLAFVTNAGLDAGLSDFLQAIGNAPDIASLPADVLIAFQHVARGYAATTPPLASSEADLFTWLRGLAIHTDRGQLEDQDAALLELADVVVTYSEIELLQRQAKQISRDIISQVRRKVAHSTTVVPASDDQLRRDKGLVVTELLGVLSLSTQAYEQLKAGQGRDTVKTLSRLQRFCEKHGMTDHLVQILRVQGALGYLANNGKAFRQQRGLYASGEACSRPAGDRSDAAKGGCRGEGHRQAVPKCHRDALDARACDGSHILTRCTF